MNFEPDRPDPWNRLRQLTAARIALGRSGGSLPTRAVLDFALDHALARDAVHAPFDIETLATALRLLHPDVLVLASDAPDRATYLQRPDLGRRLSEDSVSRLQAARPLTSPDLAVVVSDGLSAIAAQQQASPLLAALLPRLRRAGFTLAPLCVVRHARVALMDDVGSRLEARLALILLGERPGLGTADSLGAYFVFGPRPGLTDASRNCVSNIRPDGLPPEAAAEKLTSLLLGAQRLGASGIRLKEDDAALDQPPATELSSG